MSLRHKIIQIRTQFPLFLEGCILTVIALFLLYMPSEPGLMSNLVAWIETDGKYYGQSAGIVLFLWGLALIFLSWDAVAIGMPSSQKENFSCQSNRGSLIQHCGLCGANTFTEKISPFVLAFNEADSKY